MTNGRAQEIATEIATYDKNVGSWRDREGKFVLIRGTDVVGFYDTYEQALTEGYSRFGVAPFLVKEIRHPAQAHFVSRLVAPTSA